MPDPLLVEEGINRLVTDGARLLCNVPLPAAHFAGFTLTFVFHIVIRSSKLGGQDKPRPRGTAEAAQGPTVRHIAVHIIMISVHL